MTAARLAMMVSVLAVAGCGGGKASQGLIALQEVIPDFSLRCGEVAHWEVGVLANAAKKTAQITGVGMSEPNGFRIDWVRAYRASIHLTDESRAKSSVLGLLLPPSGVTSAKEASLHDSARLLHVVVALRPPACTRESLTRSFSSRVYMFPGHNITIDYVLGGRSRTLRMGSFVTMDVCSAHPASLMKQACRR